MNNLGAWIAFWKTDKLPPVQSFRKMTISWLFYSRFFDKFINSFSEASLWICIILLLSLLWYSLLIGQWVLSGWRLYTVALPWLSSRAGGCGFHYPLHNRNLFRRTVVCVAQGLHWSPRFKLGSSKQASFFLVGWVYDRGRLSSRSSVQSIRTDY